MNKTLQGLVALGISGFVAFSSSYMLTGNSHNGNKNPNNEVNYKENGTTQDPFSVRIQNIMTEETPTPDPTQEPTPEPTPEPTNEPSQLPEPPNNTTGGGSTTPPDSSGNDPRTPASGSPAPSRGPIRFPR